MSAVSIEDVIERVRVASGAEFAFVLTMRGRLVTQRAPREMPELGRERIVNAARALGAGRSVERLMLPRDALVPYGGAAPIDVYFAVAAERAVVCAVVLYGWPHAPKINSAVNLGRDEIERKLASAFDSRVLSRGTAELPPSTRREPATTGSVPPPNTESPYSATRVQSAPQQSSATVKRRRDQGAPTVKASPRALDRASMGQPHSSPLTPASVARFIAGEEPSADRVFDQRWTEHRVLEEIDSDAREVSEPPSAPLPPTARRESFPPDTPIESGRATRKSWTPNVTVELADADDELLEAVRLNDARTVDAQDHPAAAAPKKKEGGDALPATQRVPEPGPVKPSS